MPTNLPPEYYEADKRYRAAGTTAEKISTLEDLLSTIPKHKGTDKLRADLRRRLAKLKDAQQSSKGKGKRDSVFQIGKEGAGQVVLVGMANVGKSALVEKLTNASPQVSASPHTTWKPMPGMMFYENVQIQLIDTPPLSRDFTDPGLYDLIRRADIILLMVDLLTDPVHQLEETIAMLGEKRIFPIQLEGKLTGQIRPVFKPVVVMANKCDDQHCDENFEIFCELLEGDWDLIATSVTSGRNLESLKKILFEQLDIVRVFSKPPGADPNFSKPFVMKRGDTVEDFAGGVHQDFVQGLKSARVWGKGVFDGQLVGRDHVLHDGDVVELDT
jgi:ribosome-interacting GTPase 1